MQLKQFLLASLAAGLAVTGLGNASGAVAAAPRPNVLMILADDCTYNDLPLYGGQNAKTPNLDRLAAQGLTFNRAYVTMAMCQPARAELYTGQFPLRNGCAWNHSPSRPGTRSLPDHLKARGYRVGLTGKSHVEPRESFAFEVVPGFDDNCVRRPTQPHQLAGIREFLTRDASEPFCLVVALVEPHVPWVMGDASQYPPDQIKLPANIADTKRTREDFGRYLAEITYMDGQVGEILAALQATGVASNTLVLFSSEQGSQFPGNKWTCWDTGLRTGLIARWPGHIPAGKRTEALVQYADVAPTLVELAGGNPADAAFAFDGSSFAAVLRGELAAHRPFAYGMHNNQPEGPSYPSRTVSDGAWRYIRNLTPEELYVQKYLMGTQGDGGLNNPYWGTWLFTAADHPRTLGLVKRYQLRPAEELYHTAADPYELTNLIADPEHAEVRQRLSAELDRWMNAQGDPGRPMDTREALQAARRGEHKFYPQR
jgi:N-sulfoglucosamine sulfohydrolase